MSASYDPLVPTDKDWVRLLCGDVDTSSAELQDEEINAILAEETASGKALKYFAAASALSYLQSKWAGKGKGLITKTVSKLSRTWGVTSDHADILKDRIDWLRQRGAWLLKPSPRAFRVAGNPNGSIFRGR